MSVAAALTVAALIAAVLCIAADYAGHRRWFYVFKPTAMICIIALSFVLATTSSSSGLNDYRFWIIAGLCIALVGDILLMLEDRFLAGLAAFMLTHWCYMAAFSSLSFEPNWLLLPVWLAAGLFLFALFKPKPRLYRIAVLAYIAIIVTMCWLAVENWRLTQVGGAAALGAMLFLLSDTLIGFRRFRGNWYSAQALILVSYFPAQWLFAISLASN